MLKGSGPMLRGCPHVERLMAHFKGDIIDGLTYL